MSITPFLFAQLLGWCDRNTDTPSPSLCCPRLIDGLWIACDGVAMAWRRSDSPHDSDPLLGQGLVGLQHRVHDIEFHWPTEWRNLPVETIPKDVRRPCSHCDGSGLAPSFIDPDATVSGFGLWPCDACDGTGHADGAMLVRLDVMPEAYAIAIDYLLRIGPLDRLACIENPLVKGCRTMVVGETPNGLRYAISPIRKPTDRSWPTHVLATTPAKDA